MIDLNINYSDLQKLNRNLNRLAEETGQTLKDVLPSQMRLLATDLAYNTYPKGKGSKDNEQHQKKIAARIREVYPSPGRIVNELKKRNPGIGIKFAALLAKRDFRKAKLITDKYFQNLEIGSFDGGKLHKEQSFQKNVSRQLLVTGYQRVESYIKKTARKSGFAKGGFATASRQLGGVRGIPGWATRQNAPGRGMVTGDGKKLTVTLINDVDYIEIPLKSHDEQAAVKYREVTIERLLKRIQTNKIKQAIAKT